MKKALVSLLLILLAIPAFAHVWEIRVNQAQNGTLTWYLQSYHSVTECGIGNSGLVINGVQYPIEQVFAGSTVPLSPTVFAVNGSQQRLSYATIHTPFLGTTLSVFPYSNNVCWDNLVSGTGSFTPPPPPVCTSCPITSWSNTTGVANNNGTACNPTDDILSATITVNHLSCGSITGDGKFRVVLDPNGANVSYGPFTYSTGIVTNVAINLPYGTNNSTQLKVIDDDYPCFNTHGLSVPGGQFNGVVDNVPPVVICQGDITLNVNPGQCGAMANFSATATDNCTAVPTIAYSKNPGTLFSVGETIVTVTATDAANNVSTPCSFKVTVIDNSVPTINCPAAVTVACDGSTDISFTGIAGATDPCGIASLTHADVSAQDPDVNNAGHYNYTIARTWSATDAHNNPASCVQTITVQDITAPAITAPSNVTVSCDAVTAPSATGTATGSDNCSPVTITYADASTQDMDVNAAAHYNYVITRTWTATDVSNNMGTAIQTITVQDVTVPAITTPSDITVNCDAITAPATTGTATGSDNCSPVTITYADASTQDVNVNAAAHYNYVITRTWTVADASSNASTGVQIITVQDVTAPAITAPSNVTVNCDAVTAPSATGTATGSDNCSPVTITYANASTQDVNVNAIAHYNYAITRTWTATDASGNASIGVQTITVQDVTMPSLLCPAATTASCNTTPAKTGNATSADNCGPVVVSYTDASTKSTNTTSTSYYDYTITRTWKTTDVTGNVNTCNQVITVSEMHGAAIAVTPVNTINSNHPDYTIFLGYGPQSVTLAASVQGGAGAKTYSWVPATGVANPNSATTSVSPVVTTTYTVTITDATGCSIVKSFTIHVVDVRCGNKVQICHYPPGNTGNPQQQCLPASAIAAHLAHGCILGTCPQNKNSGNSSDETHELDNIAADVMKVYPNPNSGSFTIEVPANMPNAEIIIMDMAGKTVVKKTIESGNTIKIDLGNESRGVYMINVISGDKRQRSQVSVQ